jgi:hypothetical protein
MVTQPASKFVVTKRKNIAYLVGRDIEDGYLGKQRVCFSLRLETVLVLIVIIASCPASRAVRARLAATNSESPL